MSPARFSRRAALGAAGALGLAAVSGCAKDTPTPDSPAQVAYQLSWTHSVQFGGTYIAADRGLFTAQGLDVTLAPGGPNVAGDAATVSEKVLVNISGADGVARSNVEGADLVVVGAQYQKNPAVILSLAKAPIDEPGELVGRKIGVAGTDTPSMDAFLKINKIAKDKVTFVPTQYDPAVLTAGQVDGILCFYSDLPVALATKGVEGHTMLLADHGYDSMSQTYTVLRSTLEDDAKRAELVRLFRADAQGWQIYHDDPRAAAELTVRLYPDAGLDLATQKRQAVSQVDVMFSKATDDHGFGWYTPEQVATNLRLFEVLGIQGQTEAMWDHSILDEVYRDGPRV